MKKVCFPLGFVNLIMSYVSSVSYSVMVNCSNIACFTPTKGLHQGDSLSPYLFLICREGLASLIFHTKNFGKVTGLAASKNSPMVTHLFFADDFMLFCKAVPDEIRAIKSILEVYERGMGQ